MYVPASATLPFLRLSLCLCVCPPREAAGGAPPPACLTHASSLVREQAAGGRLTVGVTGGWDCHPLPQRLLLISCPAAQPRGRGGRRMTAVSSAACLPGSPALRLPAPPPPQPLWAATPTPRYPHCPPASWWGGQGQPHTGTESGSLKPRQGLSIAQVPRGAGGVQSHYCPVPP